MATISSVITLTFMFHSLFSSIIMIVFSHQLMLEFEWQQVSSISRTLLCILTVLKNAVVWMVSTRSPTSKSSSSFSNPLVTVPKAPITSSIIFICMFHSFSIPYQGRGTYPSNHILSVLFCGQPGQQSQQFCKFFFFLLLLIIIRSGLLAEIRWSVCMLKSHRSLCVLFSRTGTWLCIYICWYGQI